jgi:hypothetical protein
VVSDSFLSVAGVAHHRLMGSRGALLTYAWHAFVQTPQVPVSTAVDRLGDVVFGVLAVVLVLTVSIRADRERAAMDGRSAADDPSSATSSRL